MEVNCVLFSAASLRIAFIIAVAAGVNGEVDRFMLLRFPLTLLLLLLLLDDDDVPPPIIGEFPPAALLLLAAAVAEDVEEVTVALDTLAVAVLTEALNFLTDTLVKLYI